MAEHQETLLGDGDCVHQRPDLQRHRFDWSPDMECLEPVDPADFTGIDV